MPRVLEANRLGDTSSEPGGRGAVTCKAIISAGARAWSISATLSAVLSVLCTYAT